MSNKYDSILEPVDWRYSAAILGLIKYFKFENEEYEEIDFQRNLDSIEYNKKDIIKERFLAFAENEFKEDMLHKDVERLLYKDEIEDDKIKRVNEKLVGNTVMKKIFLKTKFDGSNKNDILNLINVNREQIIFETFKNKKNLYANYCNTNLLLEESQSKSHCRLLGYNIDRNRKSKSIAYNFNTNTFVSTDMIEFDFIPFAFSNTYEALFINNNNTLSDLVKTNNRLNQLITEEKNQDNLSGNARSALFKGIINSAEFIDYDVEVIVKNRDNTYYESLFIRREAIEILKSISNINAFTLFYKLNDNNYIDVQREVINCILNLLHTDYLIELFLKSDRNYSYVITRLIDINLRIKGADIMNEGMKGAFACAKKVTAKIERNKVSSYKKKLISAIVAEDYNRVCDILLQLSSYSDISFGFAYDLFENFEKNKELAYTFINALDENMEGK